MAVNMCVREYPLQRLLARPPHEMVHTPGSRCTADFRLIRRNRCCSRYLISQKVSMKLFCKSQFPHKSVNSFFVLVTMKNELMDLLGAGLLQNDFIISFLR
jgi:hypothetical protein